MKSPAQVDFVREAAISFFFDSLDKIAAFVAFVFFANYFSTASFGAAYTVIGVSMMAGSVPKSVGVGLKKRVSEDTDSYERFFVAGIAILIVFSAIATIVGLLIAELFLDRFRTLAIAGVLHVSTRPFLYIVERIYDGVGTPGAAAGLDFVDGILTALLRFVLILGFGMGEEGLLYSGALSAVLVGGGSYLWRFGFPGALPTRATFEDLAGFSGWALLSRVGNNVYLNAPIVLAGTLLSPTFASYIKSAQNLLAPAQLPVRSVIESIFVQISGSTERGESLHQPIQNGIDMAAILAFPLFIGSLIIGDDLMLTLYGEGYADSGPVLMAVLFGFIFEAYGRVLRSALQGSNNIQYTARVNWIQVVVFVPGYTITMILFGPAVFLAVFAVSYALRTILVYWYTTQLLVDNSDFQWRFVFEQAFSAAVMGVVVWAVMQSLVVRSWRGLVIPLSIGGVVYFGSLFVVSGRFRGISRTVIAKFWPA